LTQLANRIDRGVRGSPDPARVQALAGTVRGIAKR
jgi:hypothetical protein